MKSPTDRPTLRGGNAHVNFFASFALVFFLLLGAKGQEIGTAITDGSNTTLTIKHRVRLERVQMDRHGSITFFYRKVKLNNANDTEVGDPGPLIPVSRQLSAVLSETQNIGGDPVSLQINLTHLSKFGDAWYAADNP